MAVLPANGTSRSVANPSVVATPATTSCSVGSEPEFSGYDPVNHETYVPIFGSGEVVVLSNPCKVALVFDLGSSAEPVQATFDPRDNYVFVSDYHLNQVYVISGKSIIAEIKGFDEPTGITYDPVMGDMAIASTGNNTVIFVYGTSIDPYDPAVSVGSRPYQICYDPLWSELLVTNSGSDTVSVLNASSGSYLRTAYVGSTPLGIVADPADGCIYVAGFDSDDVTCIIDGKSQFTISGFDDPAGVTWNQATLQVYVANYGSGTVVAINYNSIVQTIKVGAGSEPYGLSYDDATDKVYVSGLNSGDVYVVS